MPASKAFVPPLVVSCAIVTTWAWFAAILAAPAVATLFALGLGFALFASWLRFAHQTARAASKASMSLMQQLQDRPGGRRFNIYDQTTGLYNRVYLEMRLQEEFLRCRRFGLSAALLTVRPAAVNVTAFSSDTWDALAADLSRALANAVRPADLPAALAPMEFAICLVQCDRERATHAVERLLQELDGREVMVGLAVYPEDGGDPKGMIELARRRGRPLSLRQRAA